MRLSFLICGLAFAAGVPAQDFHLESVGVRGGFSGTSSGQDFNQAEAVANWDLPWQWALGRQWHLQSRLDLSAGWLGDRTVDAAIGTLGPSLVIARENFPLSLEGGLSLTLLSQDDFATKDFGTKFQFTSHAGLNLDLFSHVRLDYRFQHMSNAGLSDRNPGLNMHMFGISYLF